MSINISTLAVIERYIHWIKDETGQRAVLEVSAGTWGGWNGQVVSLMMTKPDLIWMSVTSPSLLAAVEDLAGRLTVAKRAGWSLEPLDRWRESRWEVS